MGPPRSVNELKIISSDVVVVVVVEEGSERRRVCGRKTSDSRQLINELRQGGNYMTKRETPSGIVHGALQDEWVRPTWEWRGKARD